ncbi:MAG: TlpA family protein disulfide reductase [bacterium]|nr:TlpA family protein disulfide reductase [bacterium]
MPATAEGDAASTAGGSVMEFDLASLDGGKISPRDLGEDLILIDFWATWCGPCHLQADILAKLYPELKSRGVEFLAVSLGEPEAVVREFVVDRPFAYPVLVDPNDYIAGKYGIFVLPTVVMLDREGTIMYVHEGISTASRLTSAIDEILSRQASEGSSDRRTARDKGAEVFAS